MWILGIKGLKSSSSNLSIGRHDETIWGWEANPAYGRSLKKCGSEFECHVYENAIYTRTQIVAEHSTGLDSPDIYFILWSMHERNSNFNSFNNFETSHFSLLIVMFETSSNVLKFNFSRLVITSRTKWGLDWIRTPDHAIPGVTALWPTELSVKVTVAEDKNAIRSYLNKTNNGEMFALIKVLPPDVIFFLKYCSLTFTFC